MTENIIDVVAESEEKAEKKNNLIKHVDSNTLIDRFKRLEVKISPFHTVSKSKHDAFQKRLDDIKKWYKRELDEYQEAIRTNKLTLSCNPEININIKQATTILEREVDEYEPEYAYLSLKQRLETFISNMNILYIQIIKNKKNIYIFLEKAEAKFEEISEDGILTRIAENNESRKEEIVSLLYCSKYMINKSKIRLYISSLPASESLISDLTSESDATEYFRCITSDLERLEEIASEDLKFHPLNSRVIERMQYLKKFGFKSYEKNILNLDFFKRLFYIEDALIPRMKEEIKNALEFVSVSKLLNDDQKQCIKLIIMKYKEKIKLSDIVKLIMFFNDEMLQVMTKPDDIYKSINQQCTTQSMFEFVRSMSKEYLAENSKSGACKSIQSKKYIYVMSFEDEDKKSLKRALDGVLEYKIKENELYIRLKSMSILSIF